MTDTDTRKARALGINHVVLEVDDLDKALDFYGSFLQFTLRGRSDHNAFIDLGDQFIQLTLGRTQVADTKRHFGLVVDDREAVKRAMARLGITSINERLNILDPWGNRIEIVPYDACQFSKTPEVLAGMGVARIEKTAAAIEELKKKGMAAQA